MNSVSAYCVFRLRSGWLALDAAVVGEVADLSGIVPLPGCAPAVLGLAALRGRAVAIVDLATVLGESSANAPVQEVQRCLLVRLPGYECAVTIERVEGVLAAEVSGQRSTNRLAEPPWIAGFQAFTGVTDSDGKPLVAAIIDPAELSRRLDTLRFRPSARL